MNLREAKTRILIVENERLLAENLAESLECFGYEISGIVGEGAESIALAQKLSPDLILMAIRLNGEMTGIEAAEEITRTFPVPIIFLLADQEEFLGHLTKVSHPHGYILKPFRKQELRVLIESSIVRFQSERRLIESERWNRLIVETSHNAFVSININGLITDWNPSAERIFGWSKLEAIGRPLADTIIPPELREAHFRGIQRYIETGQSRLMNKMLELRAVHRDGHEFPVEMTIATTIINRTPHFFAFIHDISERKEVENLISMQATLKQSNRDLERFAQITSHDLQEPLRTVSMYTQLLSVQLKDTLTLGQKDYVNNILNGAARMQQLIRDILLFSKVGAVDSNDRSFFDSEQALKNAISNMQVTIDNTGTEIIHGKLPEIFGNLSQVSQLFQNLISNSIKFRGKHHSVIKIDAEKSGGYWLFTFRDNGMGFDQRYGEKIFEMFQRLFNSDEYPGTGMGLAICKKVLDLHGGRIWAESKPGSGATFYFTLPLTDSLRKPSDENTSTLLQKDAPESSITCNT